MDGRGKIAVAMSGGVDSSVAALLLKEQGSDVVGVNLNLWSCFKGSKAKTCCSPEDRRDAMRVCEKLGIPFHSIDMRDEFKDKVILNFIEEYSCGRTPNPCIRCNTLIKFDLLLKWLDKELGISELATGHYARILQDDMHLAKGIDSTKDQSYFLFDIKPEVLRHLHFPLGELTKEDVRKMAVDAGLPVAEKAESQEVCFIPDGDVASFIEDFYPGHAKPAGKFVDKEGREIGSHRGTHAFTIGQRRGLGVGFGERRYVAEIRPDEGEVVLGDNEDLMKSECTAERLNLLEDMDDEFDAGVKIRYASPPVLATISLFHHDRARKARITFKTPVRAITPGQATVFYRGDLVIGGGWIV